jgi:DNA (cytosine-5)-methyltransferase 1
MLDWRFDLQPKTPRLIKTARNATPRERPIAIDLFAGAGGLSLGFEQAGFDIAAAVEIDPIHCATHKYNFPNSATLCASVVNVSGEQIRQRAELGDVDIDVVFGGAPCQGFSLIGKRILEDPRNQLVNHFVRLVSELRPKYFVFENVKGLTLGKHVKFLQELMSALSDCGYSITLPYKVLNARDFQVPQDRQRLFILGARTGLPLATYPCGSLKKVTVEEAISDLPNADQFPELIDSDHVRVDWQTVHKYARILRGLERDQQDFGYSRLFDSSLLTSSTRTIHTELSQRRFQDTEHGKTEPISRFRKLPPDGLCNTLRAGTDSARGAFTSPRPIHPRYPRVITVREAARLHSYPDWFRFHATKWHGFRQIGNSVPPLLARAVGAEVMKALALTPVKPKQVLRLGESALLNFEMGSAARFFSVPKDTIAQRQRTRDELTRQIWDEACA